MAVECLHPGVASRPRPAFFVMSFRIALANLHRPHTAAESVSLAVEAVAEAGRAQARVVCFPEWFVPGHRTPDDRSAPDLGFPASARARAGAAAAAARIAVILGTERIVDGSARLTALVIN